MEAVIVGAAEEVRMVQIHEDVKVGGAAADFAVIQLYKHHCHPHVQKHYIFVPEN